MNKKAKTYGFVVLAVVALVAIVGLVINFGGNMTGAYYLNAEEARRTDEAVYRSVEQAGECYEEMGEKRTEPSPYCEERFLYRYFERSLDMQLDNRMKETLRESTGNYAECKYKMGVYRAREDKNRYEQLGERCESEFKTIAIQNLQGYLKCLDKGGEYKRGYRGSPGECRLPEICGDGQVVGDEQCDDGDRITETCAYGQTSCYVCNSDCQRVPGQIFYCGDGRTSGREACDDGAQNGQYGKCRIDCLGRTYCGNKIREGPEECDDGNNPYNTDACLIGCKAAKCGDGYPWAGVEQCDDANTNNNDACLNNCQTATCGDIYVQTGIEQCDDGNINNNDVCVNCQSAICGDGYIQTGIEECDDANTNNNDVCLNNCQTAICGDGYTQIGVEQCDDGGQNGQYGKCKTDCSGMIFCGDEIINGQEACDDGSQNGQYGKCNSDCTSIISCGDGIINGPEQCDDTNSNNNDACINCQNAYCGDGFVRTGMEQCDDANSNNNDACLTNCQIAICGDSQVQTGVEQCDDGNKNGQYWKCKSDCSGLGPYCGDGMINGPEECDDGNYLNWDGCNGDCIIGSCSDSDGGLNYLEQGTIFLTGTNFSRAFHTENCSVSFVNESFCQVGLTEGFGSVMYDCANTSAGTTTCQNGACI